MIYQLKIKLRGISKPPVWRRVQVPSQFTFDNLHEVIQAAFGWEDEHLYQFGDAPYSRKLNIAIPNEDDDDFYNRIDSRRYTLRDFYEKGGSKLCYTYDFGDDWTHDITLEKVISGERLFATCTGGKGACPPEDCGGCWGYEDMKANGEIDDANEFSLEEADDMVKEVRCTNSVVKTVKNSRKRKKIYPKEWVAYMPYSAVSDIDIYYTGIANEVFGIIEDHDILCEVGIDSDDNKDIAIRLTQWFQDVVSEGGMWTAFTSECKRRYGRYVPFYAINESDYYPDEVNDVDVRFLLWHYVQMYHTENTLINPENSGLESIANDIYELFESEFEDAPINDDWRNALHPRMFDEPLLFSFKSYLYKFITCDFINVLLFDDVSSEIDDIKSQYDGEEATKYKYDVVTQSFFEDTSTMLGYNAAQWATLILKQSMPNVAERLAKMETLETRPYLLVDKDGEFLYLKDLFNMDDEPSLTYKVPIVSLGEYKEKYYIPQTTFVLCRLTMLDGLWYVNGLLSFRTREDLDIDHGDMKRLRQKLCRSGKRKAFEDFRKASGGKEFVYLKDRSAVIDFYKRMYGQAYKYSLVPEEADENVVLTATPNCGLCVMPGKAVLLKSKDNPYYDEAAARDSCFAMFCSPTEAPYEVACRMLNLGMLSDAALNSTKDYEHGRQLVQNNAQFLLDYFAC